jgi:integrase/recombinase XerD
MANMTPLRRRMVEDMTIQNMTPSTQQTYLHVVSKFSRHFICLPDKLGV